MARIAWVLTDPTDSSSYSFEVNPLNANTPTVEKTITEMASSASSGLPILFEGANKAGKMSISGTLLSQEQFDALNLWNDKRKTILVTDDLGQQWTMYMVRLTMNRVRNTSFPWKHTFNIDYVQVDQ